MGSQKEPLNQEVNKCGFQFLLCCQMSMRPQVQYFSLVLDCHVCQTSDRNTPIFLVMPDEMVKDVVLQKQRHQCKYDRERNNLQYWLIIFSPKCLGAKVPQIIKLFEFWNVCIDFLNSFNIEILEGPKYEFFCLLVSFGFQSISVLVVRDIQYFTRLLSKLEYYERSLVNLRAHLVLNLYFFPFDLLICSRCQLCPLSSSFLPTTTGPVKPGPVPGPRWHRSVSSL